MTCACSPSDFGAALFINFIIIIIIILFFIIFIF